MVDMNDPEVIDSLKYLLVPKEEKIQTQARPFDGKKNVFVPDPKEGFIDAEIISEENGNVKVKTGKGEERVVKSSDINEMNPPKYEKCDDMADLTYLNDATVLHNLRTRFISWYIYTYSGLFCVTINPFKRLPLYTMKMVTYYRGKKKNEVPPHLYLVADNAYAAMMRDRENQSMLITGESGAGKTENTKKVIQYFAFVAAGVSGKKVSAEEANKPSLEDQIVSANPVMEAYGNAKTTRNNNSSRFGKFIRIHFSANYGIAGADIESYLLEKSRITYQMPAERNYHIFYQLCSKAFPEVVKNQLFLEHDAGLYNFINQGMLTIDKVDDEQEMKDTKKAFEVLLFTEESQLDLFKITAAVMHWGNQKWKQKPREEQAEADGLDEVTKVATLLGLDLDPFVNGLLKPRIKVGKEFVNKGQNQAQVTNSCAALSKAMYARAFMWIVDKCNETLDVKTVKRAYFIGVLDIAGFETFEENGFEQLCINFTNERLQQFFNNFMFVLEQEEYAKEGIVWEMMSFGADLQATIDLIDKPMGIFSMLEEECVVPKGTDTTYKEKLYAKHLGKHTSFGKPKPKKSKYEAHFDLHHYAGTVSYSVTGWLDKNKDPINEFVAAMFKSQQKNQLLSFLFREIGVEDTNAKGGKKGSQTISANHREQLNKLMKTLNATHPHFVRCIIPNEIKTGGIIDAHLVMHQLHCNGVLEGIRICRKGFPSRIVYLEFIQRYSILNPAACKGVSDAAGAKKATDAILQTIKMDPELYRLGLTKVLFKAGVLGTLEEHRDAAISTILTMLQSHIRTYLMKKNIQNLIDQKKSIGVLQRNIKSFITLRSWQWWTLMTFVKPLLNNSKKEEERKAREAEEARLAAEAANASLAAAAAAEAERQRQEEERKAAEAKFKAELEAKAREAEENNARLAKERENLAKALEEEKEAAASAQEEARKLSTLKSNLEKKVKELEAKVSDSEAQAGDLSNKKKKLETEIADLRKNLSETSAKLAKAEVDIKTKDAQLQKLQDDLSSQEGSNSKLSKEKKQLEQQNSDLSNSLEQESGKVNHLTKVLRKLEGDLRSVQSQKDEIESLKTAAEDSIRKKESEISGLNARIAEEQASAADANKKIRTAQQQLHTVEAALESESEAKSRVEKQRIQLASELGRVQQELDEANNEKNVQSDKRRQLEDEITRLKRELEEQRNHHSTDIAELRKKNQDSLSKIGLLNDQLQRDKTTYDKEKKALVAKVDEANARGDQLAIQKANSDKNAEKIDQRLKFANSKIDESAREINELNSQKSALNSKISSLVRQKEEAEDIASQNLTKFRKAQNEVKEANERADAAERLANKLRAERRTANV